MAAIAAAGGTVIIATYSGIELYEYVAERIEWQSNADIYIVEVGDYTKDDKIQEYAYKAIATNVSPTAIRKYLVQDWARRTAVESRLRNDFPTWKDRQNSNINSLDFLEFNDERTTSRRVDGQRNSWARSLNMNMVWLIDVGRSCGMLLNRDRQRLWLVLAFIVL